MITWELIFIFLILLNHALFWMSNCLSASKTSCQWFWHLHVVLPSETIILVQILKLEVLWILMNSLEAFFNSLNAALCASTSHLIWMLLWLLKLSVAIIENQILQMFHLKGRVIDGVINIIHQPRLLQTNLYFTIIFYNLLTFVSVVLLHVLYRWH